MEILVLSWAHLWACCLWACAHCSACHTSLGQACAELTTVSALSFLSSCMQVNTWSLSVKIFILSWAYLWDYCQACVNLAMNGQLDAGRGTCIWACYTSLSQAGFSTVSPLSCTGSWMQGTCSCIVYSVQCTLYRQLYAGGTCIYMLLVTSVRLVMYRQLDAGGSSSWMQQSRSSLTFHITQECNSPLCSHSQGELPTLCM